MKDKLRHKEEMISRGQISGEHEKQECERHDQDEAAFV